jgi:beta-glucosidase/6-phospho-beta-glucosidase/beta-galactosidase
MVLLLPLFVCVSLAIELSMSQSSDGTRSYNISLLSPTSSIPGTTPPSTEAATSTSTSTTTPTASPTPSFIPNKTTVEDLWAQIEKYSLVLVAAKSNLTDSTEFELPPAPPAFLSNYLSESTKNLKFPKGFKYGVASAATQVEGAAKEDGKGPSVWDYGPHVYPELYTGAPDVTNDFYHRYKNDFARLKAMGVNTFSLSIAWTRIYPLGSGQVNEAGLAFYDKVIDEAIKNNLEPVVTLFHWDTPLALSAQYGAWMSEKIIEDYNKYAETMFRHLGDRVKMWITFNEPRVFCSQVAGIPYTLTYPDGTNSTNAPYQCTHNLLVAHGTAVQTYRKLVKEGTIAAGQIGLKNDDNKPTPWSDSEEDKEASDRHADFYIGIFAKPIYVDGDYPMTCRETLGDMLPPLTPEEQKLVKGSADFYAQDLYRVNTAKAAPNGIKTCMKNSSDPNWPTCQDNDIQYTSGAPGGWGYGQQADPRVSWLINSWFALREQLKYLTETFPSKGGIYISEFGWAEAFENQRTEHYQIVSDYGRESYYMDYLNEFLLAIHEDKIDLRGIFAWSLYDNYEWASGLTQKFGLQYVNFTDPALPRQFKRSFFSLRNAMKQHLEAEDFNS